MDNYLEVFYKFLSLSVIPILGIIGTLLMSNFCKYLLKDESKSNEPYKPMAIEKIILLDKTSSLLRSNNNEIEFKINRYRNFLLVIFIIMEIINIVLIICLLVSKV